MNKPIGWPFVALAAKVSRPANHFRKTLQLQSMSCAADCYDNAFMESCLGNIKTELEMTVYDSFGKAGDEIR